MSRVDFELDINGLRELMKSAEMKAVLEEAGSAVEARAESMSGAEYGHRVHDASFVSIVNIYPDSKEAAKDNYENNTALKALGSSGYPRHK